MQHEPRPVPFDAIARVQITSEARGRVLPSYVEWSMARASLLVTREIPFFHLQSRLRPPHPRYFPLPLREQ